MVLCTKARRHRLNFGSRLRVNPEMRDTRQLHGEADKQPDWARVEVGSRAALMRSP
jgi:hypothetical protein